MFIGIRATSFFCPPKFSPKTLFGGGVQGVWYDPSDLNTLFQDSGGTIPVTAVEQPVGRILDLSGNNNHATQGTAGSRPVLRSRFNLLTYSQEFDNAAWSKLGFLAFGSGSVVNAIAAPDGSVTADLLTENTAAGAHGINASASTSITTGSSYIFSISLKSNGRNVVNIYGDAVNGYLGATGTKVNLTTGTVVSAGSATNVSIQDQGNGWFRVAITCTATNVTASPGVYLTDGTNQSYVGNGTSGVYIWGAQLVAAKVFPANTYQSITIATSYATGTAFPRYLAFDGVDDFLVTGNINFTATDEVTTWVGVGKNSDAAVAMIAELTTGLDNSWHLASPSAISAGDYQWRSRGTVSAIANSPGTYAAPIVNVITGIGDISNDVCQLRVNGTLATSITTDQGTGNFTTAPIYIGRRGGTSLPFNGNLYSFIVRGKTTLTSQVRATEEWIAAKTPITI